MNEIYFKNLEDIDNFSIRFKCFDGADGYQATFHVYDKTKPDIHYQIDFEISGTQYNSSVNNTTQLNKDYINKKFGNLENCFQAVGIKYIKEKIKNNNLNNETVNLLTLVI